MVVGNSGSVASLARSASQTRRTATVDAGERRDPLLAALAAAAHVGARPEMDVGAAQADQLGHAQSRLDREQQQGVIAPPGPGRAVRGAEEGLDLGLGQERDEVAGEALGWNGQHSADRLRVLGMAQGGVPEQRTDGRQAGIPGPDAVAPIALEVVEEGADERRVDLADIERRWSCPGAVGGERQEQAERVAIGGDRLRARLALPDEPIGEERLEGRGERAHGRSPRWRSRRSPAAASSSGAADRYQYVAAGLTWPRYVERIGSRAPTSRSAR